MRRSLRHSLAQELRARIRAGEWRPGERIPSEPELARQETVSRSSMRAAITLLEEEGYVSRRHGSGTYVTHMPTLPSDLGRNFGVSSLIRSTGLEPGTEEESAGLEAAPAAVAEALGVAEGDPVSVLRRVRTAGDRRVVDVTDWCRDRPPGARRPAGGRLDLRRAGRARAGGRPRRRAPHALERRRRGRRTASPSPAARCC